MLSSDSCKAPIHDSSSGIHEFLNICFGEKNIEIKKESESDTFHFPLSEHIITVEDIKTEFTRLENCKLEDLNNKYEGHQNVAENNLLQFQLHVCAWEADKILQKSEPNWKENFVKTTHETEEKEEENLRKERNRLTKAALRATEPAEKKMLRRQRDKIAKAIARSKETEEQRRVRLDRDRAARAALRAAETEEKRLIRRERERIKKAAQRAAETQEERALRREKSRLAAAAMRASETEEERRIRREKDRIRKNRSRRLAKARLSEEQRAFIREKERLKRVALRSSETEQEREMRRERYRVAKAAQRAAHREKERHFIIGTQMPNVTFMSSDESFASEGC